MGYYITAIIILSFMGVTSVTLIALFRPVMDNTLLIATIVGLLTPVVGVFLALMQKNTHNIVNSRMTELLDITRKAARAEGKLEGPNHES